LAQKIDALIEKQPTLTKEQLQSLRPILSIGLSGRKTELGGHTVDYSISVPGNQEIASLRAYLIDAKGRNTTRIADGKIQVVTPGKTAKIRVQAFTTGLLATIIERDVTLLDDPVGQGQLGLRQ
jgi:hypothetical protein